MSRNQQYAIATGVIAACVLAAVLFMASWYWLTLATTSPPKEPATEEAVADPEETTTSEATEEEEAVEEITVQEVAEVFEAPPAEELPAPEEDVASEPAPSEPPSDIEDLRAKQAEHCDHLSLREQHFCYTTFYRDVTGEDEGGNPVEQIPPGTPGRPSCA